VPSSAIDDDALDSDVQSRAEELSSKMTLQSTAMTRLARQRQELAEVKAEIDKELNRASTEYDSAYLSQILDRERNVARLGQRARDLRRMQQLALKIQDMEADARRLMGQEAELRSEIKAVRERAESDTTKLDRLRSLFLDCLVRSRIPGFFKDDSVDMSAPWFMPEVVGKNSGEFALTSFETLGSGGKKTLFKCCFALAVHLLANEQGVPLPSLLILDSPMKNISERENREQFLGFNQLLYELAFRELKGTQFIVIDKEFSPPSENIALDLTERYMNPDDPEHQPLLRLYSGK
jgi:hypothetical protein